MSGRGRWARAIGVVVVTASMLTPGAVASESASARAASTRPHLSPRVMAAAMRLPGTVVRRVPGAQVRRVEIPAALGAAGSDIYRVRVQGRYPPRALRYQLLVDGRPDGYAIPTRDADAVQAVTTDAAVLTGRLAVRYGRGAPTPPASGSPPPLRAPSFRLPHLPDPAARGPLAVTTKRYDLGDQVFKIEGLPGKVELAGDVHYPSGLPGGPYPLVLFLHGNHYSCYRGRHPGYEWPCRGGGNPSRTTWGTTTSPGGWRAHGFIVVSVSGNGVNVLGNHVDDTGMRQRGELLEKHLDLWHAWSTVGGGPFGIALRRQGRLHPHRRHGPLARRRGRRLAGDRRPGAADAVRDRRGAAARARGLHPRDRERHPDGGDAAVLRRRRLRPPGHALLRRRALPGARRPDAQGHRRR